MQLAFLQIMKRLTAILDHVLLLQFFFLAALFSCSKPDNSTIFEISHSELSSPKYFIYSKSENGKAFTSVEKHALTQNGFHEIQFYDYNFELIEKFEYSKNGKNFSSGTKYIDRKAHKLTFTKSDLNDFEYTFSTNDGIYYYAEKRKLGLEIDLKIDDRSYEAVECTKTTTTGLKNDSPVTFESKCYLGLNKGLLYEKFEFNGYSIEKKLVNIISEAEFSQLKLSHKTNSFKEEFIEGHQHHSSKHEEH